MGAQTWELRLVSVVRVWDDDSPPIEGSVLVPLGLRPAFSEGTSKRNRRKQRLQGRAGQEVTSERNPSGESDPCPSLCWGSLCNLQSSGLARLREVSTCTGQCSCHPQWHVWLCKIWSWKGWHDFLRMDTKAESQKVSCQVSAQTGNCMGGSWSGHWSLWVLLTSPWN